MFVKQIELQHFRCFEHKVINFTNNIALIEGANGSGKTSLLEALHYACYLRSFRTHSPRELVYFDQSTFFIKIDFEHAQEDLITLQHKLHVGYSGKKRLVKLNDKALHSYKELMDHFRIITLTEDDLGLIKLGPDMRRDFVDQAILLYKPAYIELLKSYKTIVDNRNKLLQMHQVNQDMYQVWSEQLWDRTVLIQEERKQFLALLGHEVRLMLKDYFPYALDITFTYKPKMTQEASWQDLLETKRDLFEQEKRFGRSLFGAHLDDVIIEFQGASSRMFASRGQQKLITLLIKMAQLKALGKQKGSALFLLDDFMTDFDQERAEIALRALADLQGQLIFTAPMRSSILGEMLGKRGAQRIEIST